MSSLHPTFVERLILMNQHRILEILDPDEAEYHRERQRVFELGFQAQYVPPNIDPTEVPLSISDEVHEIVEMFSALNRAYDVLQKPSNISVREIKFNGFDGNNEGGHLAYLGFCVDRFDGFKEKIHRISGEAIDGLNSHFPFLPLYRRMLEAWKQIRPIDSIDEVSVDDLVFVVEARRPPGE